MSSTSWRGQVYRALQAIDCLGRSKYEAKQAQGWQPGQPVHGLYSFGYKDLVFDRAITFTNWLRDQYPHVRLFIQWGANQRELQLRADKVFLADGLVELLGKGGRIRKIPVLHAEVLHELDLSERFFYLPAEQGWRWKDALERYVRQACDQLDIRRRGV